MASTKKSTSLREHLAFLCKVASLEPWADGGSEHGEGITDEGCEDIARRLLEAAAPVLRLLDEALRATTRAVECRLPADARLRWDGLLPYTPMLALYSQLSALVDDVGLGAEAKECRRIAAITPEELKEDWRQMVRDREKRIPGRHEKLLREWERNDDPEEHKPEEHKALITARARLHALGVDVEAAAAS